MKHIEVDLHYVRNQEHNGLIRVLLVHSTIQLVDPVTKSLSKPTFQRMVPTLGGVSSHLTWGGIVVHVLLSTHHLYIWMSPTTQHLLCIRMNPL